MGFIPPEPRVPTSIGEIVVVLNGREPPSAEYHLALLDQYGVKIEFPGQSGDLVPHLTQGEIETLLAFMAALRERAEAALLPE
jgi:hypothetical protein